MVLIIGPALVILIWGNLCLRMTVNVMKVFFWLGYQKRSTSPLTPHLQAALPPSLFSYSTLTRTLPNLVTLSPSFAHPPSSITQPFFAISTPRYTLLQHFLKFNLKHRRLHATLTYGSQQSTPSILRTPQPHALHHQFAAGDAMWEDEDDLGEEVVAPSFS